MACLLSKALDSFCLPKQLIEANELKLHSYRIIWLITDLQYHKESFAIAIQIGDAKIKYTFFFLQTKVRPLRTANGYPR